jgi:hypothetical protein
MPGKSSSSKKGETENVRVVVRLRPLSQAELSVDQGEVVRVGPDRRSVQVLLPAEQDFAGNTRNTMKKFELDGCLDPSSTQEQTFDHSGVKNLLDAALDVRLRGCNGHAFSLRVSQRLAQCPARAAALSSPPDKPLRPCSARCLPHDHRAFRPLSSRTGRPVPARRTRWPGQWTAIGTATAPRRSTA